jgi:haloacetate dehalogenase
VARKKDYLRSFACAPTKAITVWRTGLGPYRAAATLDPTHDDSDRQAARIIECPVLALWSMGGPLDEWYADVGGPLGMLRQWGSNVRGWPVRGGHFFPEQHPADTIAARREFL